MVKMVVGAQGIGVPGSISCKSNQQSSKCCSQRRATDAPVNVFRNENSRVRQNAVSGDGGQRESNQWSKSGASEHNSDAERVRK
jgi:hypothetical protein